MKNWLQRKMRLTLLVAMQCAFLAILTGCSVPTKIASDELLPTPAEWSKPHSPGAKTYSEKAQAWLRKVECYFSETPVFTTQP